MWNIFKKAGLELSLENGLLRVDGMKSLPADQAEQIREQIRENRAEIIFVLSCPGRCKRTGKCYGVGYFQGKPGRAAECDPETCDYR
jgi:hypothetical protein